MISAFGLPEEPEPGRIALREEEVRGVHITRLAADGSGKVGDPSKIIIGRCLGTPIVLSALNDNLGLAITEGIEDGLSIFESTGLGVWAAEQQVGCLHWRRRCLSTWMPSPSLPMPMRPDSAALVSWDRLFTSEASGWGLSA